MKLYCQIFIAFYIISVLSSCSSVYMPNVPNTPMLSSKGEFSGGGHLSLKGNLSVNGAYAFADHFALIGSASYINNEGQRRDYKQKLFEVGGGYFNTFGPDDDRILEIYAGLGNGSTDRVFREFDDDKMLLSADLQEVTYRKTFIQVNYSSRKKDNLRLFGKDFGINYGTALRLSNVNMKTFIRNGMGYPREDNTFIEPIFFTRMRFTDTFQLQYTTSANFGLNSRKFVNAGNSLFTIGAVINIGGKKY
jgi:hypothetical protein